MNIMPITCIVLICSILLAKKEYTRLLFGSVTLMVESELPLYPLLKPGFLYFCPLSSCIWSLLSPNHSTLLPCGIPPFILLPPVHFTSPVVRIIVCHCRWWVTLLLRRIGTVIRMYRYTTLLFFA